MIIRVCRDRKTELYCVNKAKVIIDVDAVVTAIAVKRILNPLSI